MYCLERAQGATIKAAAEKVGSSLSQAYHWENGSKIVGPRITELQAPIQEDVLRIFRAGAIRAAKRIVELMEPGKGFSIVAATNLKAAELTLKYAGLEPAAKLTHDGELRHNFTIERVVYDADFAEVAQPLAPIPPYPPGARPEEVEADAGEPG